MKIIVASGTGFIGSALVNALVAEGHEAVVLSRSAPEDGSRPAKGVRMVRWDARSQGPWAGELEGAGAVVNLTGELIGGKRWTPRQKERILSSRVDATRAIVAAITNAPKKPGVLINVSGSGYYGNVESEEVIESSPPGSDFLAEVCRKWEAEADGAASAGVRVVKLRLGVVLGPGGGALPRMLLPFRLFAGGPIGSGRQWFPWIHRDDAIGLMLWALRDSSVSGAVNGVAPEAVTMKQFASTLGGVMHRPSWAPVPAFVLKIVLGDMAEMVLTGQRVRPARAVAGGFAYRYPRLADALRSIIAPGT